MNWANYDQVLTEMQAHGLLVDSIDFGRIVRCRVQGEDREKRGWYAVHEIAAENGERLIVGSYGIWRGDDKGTVTIKPKGASLTPEQRAAIKERARIDRARADAQRKREAERAAAFARYAWAKASPEGESAYLQAKRVTPEGAKFGRESELVLPMHNVQGQVQGLQIIRTQSQADAAKRPRKEFWPRGLAKQGSMLLLGVPEWVVLLTEGYATARTLRMATELPVAVTWDAGNLLAVARQLRKRYPRAKVLICADDDRFGRCIECKSPVDLTETPTDCPACGKPHQRRNTGVARASEAAMAVDGAWIAPSFADDAQRAQAFRERGVKLTDYNDLHLAETLTSVSDQITAAIDARGWRPAPRGAGAQTQGVGGAALRPIETIDELLERYALVYGQGGAAFDRQEHALVTLTDVQHICCSRDLYRSWAEHPERAVVRMREVGFDPACDDPAITCNLFGGWPTTPRRGDCTRLLELLEHMCSGDPASQRLYDWVLCWLAYPLQHPGAKMKTTLVIHGPQGTGKNMFFEAYMAIFGDYGRMIGQDAVEDKFNDWASRKLFLIADEVVARSDVYHVKNRLKSFITGDWLRINPKNLAAYDERNHVNLVFLSNETMPVVLEADDRRHAVIWTPAKLDADFYTAVKAEIAAGGSAALHDHLLQIDLGEFTEATPPPQTKARSDLIRSSMDSTSEFLFELQAGEVGEIPLMPIRSDDLYDAYRTWCTRSGTKAAPRKRLREAVRLRLGVEPVKKRHAIRGHVTPNGQAMYLLSDTERERFATEQDWLGHCIEQTSAAVREYREGSDG